MQKLQILTNKDMHLFQLMLLDTKRLTVARDRRVFDRSIRIVSLIGLFWVARVNWVGIVCDSSEHVANGLLPNVIIGHFGRE